MRKEKIKRAYQQGRLYDNMIQMPLWAKIGSTFVWGFNKLHYLKAVLSFVPNETIALLDISVGTAALTYQKYAELDTAKIVAVDYSEDMLNIAKQCFQSNGINHVESLHGM